MAVTNKLLAEKYGYNKALFDEIRLFAKRTIMAIEGQKQPTDHIVLSALQALKESLRELVTQTEIIEQYVKIRGKTIFIWSDVKSDYAEATAAIKAKIARTIVEAALMTNFEPLPEEEELSSSTEDEY